jgi:hypothetical protein
VKPVSTTTLSWTSRTNVHCDGDRSSVRRVEYVSVVSAQRAVDVWSVSDELSEKLSDSHSFRSSHCYGRSVDICGRAGRGVGRVELAGEVWAQGVPGSISISASFFQPVYAILISVGVSTLVVATVTLFSTMLITVSGPALARKLLGPPPIAESK